MGSFFYANTQEHTAVVGARRANALSQVAQDCLVRMAQRPRGASLRPVYVSSLGAMVTFISTAYRSWIGSALRKNPPGGGCGSLTRHYRGAACRSSKPCLSTTGSLETKSRNPAPPNWTPPLPYMTRCSARLALFWQARPKVCRFITTANMQCKAAH